MKNNSDLFDIFWENSKFSKANIGEFQKMIEEYSGAEHETPALQYPGKDYLLPRHHDLLARKMRKRTSVRRFSDKPISNKQLSSLLIAFSKNYTKSRVYPSAGATYATEIYCLINSIKSDLQGMICYYNHDNHSLSLVDKLPEWKKLSGLLNIDTNETVPAVIFLFVLFPRRVTSKYGERGGRFALLEVGHAAQNLSLRLVQENMGGVAMGGIIDDEMKKILGLSDTDAIIALGYACGLKN